MCPPEFGDLCCAAFVRNYYRINHSYFKWGLHLHAGSLKIGNQGAMAYLQCSVYKQWVAAELHSNQWYKGNFYFKVPWSTFCAHYFKISQYSHYDLLPDRLFCQTKGDLKSFVTLMCGVLCYIELFFILFCTFSSVIISDSRKVPRSSIHGGRQAVWRSEETK